MNKDIRKVRVRSHEGQERPVGRSREISSERERGVIAQGIASHDGLYLCSDEKPLEGFETPITPFQIVYAV